MAMRKFSLKLRPDVNFIVFKVKILTVPECRVKIAEGPAIVRRNPFRLGNFFYQGASYQAAVTKTFLQCLKRNCVPLSIASKAFHEILSLTVEVHL